MYHKMDGIKCVVLFGPIKCIYCNTLAMPSVQPHSRYLIVRHGTNTSKQLQIKQMAEPKFQMNETL